MIGTAPRDWDEACHAVSDAYFPHSLTPLSRHAASGVGVCTTELGPLRIAHIRWGADVAVESDHRCLWGEHPALGRARVGVRGLARALDAGCCDGMSTRHHDKNYAVECGLRDRRSPDGPSVPRP